MYELHPRQLDASGLARHEGIPIVTVHRAILDGIDAGLGGQLIDQAVETATHRSLLSREELAAIEEFRDRRTHGLNSEGRNAAGDQDPRSGF